MALKKTELQKAIESYNSKKAKLQSEITGITDCKTGLEAVSDKSEYVEMQIDAYAEDITEKTAQIAEIDEVLTKLNA